MSQRAINRGIWSLRCTRGNCAPSVSKPCWLHGQYGTNRPFGVDIVGYLLSEIGLGEAARLLVRALDTSGIPTGLLNVPLPGRMSEAAMADRLANSGRHSIAVSVGGAPELASFARRCCRGQLNIAYLFWELSTFPDKWKRLFDGFDAYWAPSTFIRDMLIACQNKPVVLIPQPVLLPIQPPAQQQITGPLKFFTFFDFGSRVSRKNPMGAIRAFLAAFPAGTEDVTLLIKARGGPRHSRAELNLLAQSDPRIQILDRLISRTEMSALMAECNVFISLHRSEGFGLGCAEALAHGKVVVATDFGGTRDFISEQTGYPVSYTLVALTEEDYPGATGSHWAEPSIEHAAHIFGELYANPGRAAERSLAGYKHLQLHNSLEAVGGKIRQAVHLP